MQTTGAGSIADQSLWTIQGRLLLDTFPVTGVSLSAHWSAEEMPEGRDNFPARWLETPLGRAQTTEQGDFSLTLAQDVLPDWAQGLLTATPGFVVRLSMDESPDARVDPAVRLHQPGVGQVFTVTAEASPSVRERVQARLRGDPGRNPSDLAREMARGGGLDAALALRQLQDETLDPGGLLRAFGPMPRPEELRTEEGRQRYVASLGGRADADAVRAGLDGLFQKASNFTSVFDLGWNIDPDRWTTGAGAWLDPSTLFGPGNLGSLLIDTDPAPYLGYRDYLLGVLGRDDAAEKLGQRFKQDFTTKLLVLFDAAAVTSGIVARALTAAVPPADIGFGLDPASLPAPGGDPAARLDALVKLSKLSSKELGLRLRLNLDLPASSQLSEVGQNISTLQAFLTDGFQSALDPVSEPLIQKRWQDETNNRPAPFFLYYEEWLLAQAPFFPENFVSVRRELATPDFSQVVDLPDQAMAADDLSHHDLLFKDTPALRRAMEIMDMVRDAHAAIDKHEYKIAISKYKAARDKAELFPYASVSNHKDIKSFIAARAASDVKSAEDLDDLNVFSDYDMANTKGPVFARWPLVYSFYGYYVFMGDAYLAMNDPAGACRYYVQLIRGLLGAAATDSKAGWLYEWQRPELKNSVYQSGNSPYTWYPNHLGKTLDEGEKRLPTAPDENPSYGYSTDSVFGAFELTRDEVLNAVDKAVARLRMGAAMLMWADRLHADDTPPSARRARELYKGVLWLHGQDPEVSPHWGDTSFMLEVPKPAKGAPINPAVAAQTLRASQALYKIANGLNVYGYPRDHVPTLRYGLLKTDADRFAAMAKATQQDYLDTIRQLEALTIEQIRSLSLVTKGGKQVDLARERHAQAQDAVKAAELQVEKVQDQIDAEQKKLAEQDSLLGQFTTFFSSVAATFKSLPFDGDQALTKEGKYELGMDGGVAGGGLGISSAGLGAVGVGAWAYMGYAGIKAIDDAENAINGRIAYLQKYDMPAAQLAVADKQHEVRIASIEADIAAADVALGQQLLYLYSNQTLNADFLSAMATVLRRVQQRYVDLAAWAGWLAERALSFDQARSINIIRANYNAGALQGMSAPDLLQLDLAELEASRVAGTRGMSSFKHVFSLASEWPMAFGQLKSTGACEFSTSESVLRSAYPGTWGHRVETVAVSVISAGGAVLLTGVLVNVGVSSASTSADLVQRTLVREPSALPFQGAGNSSVLSAALDAEQNRPFEGLGLTTSWRLEVGSPLDQFALNALADITLVVEGHCQFDPTVAQAPTLASSKGLLLSGAKFNPGALADAAAGKGAVFHYDLQSLLPAPGNPTPTIRNIGVFAFGTKLAVPVEVTLADGTSASPTLADGWAASAKDMPGSLALGSLLQKPLQDVRVVLPEPGAQAGVDLSRLSDVVLWVEFGYTSAPKEPIFVRDHPGPLILRKVRLLDPLLRPQRFIAPEGQGAPKP